MRSAGDYERESTNYRGSRRGRGRGKSSRGTRGRPFSRAYSSGNFYILIDILL